MYKLRQAQIYTHSEYLLLAEQGELSCLHVKFFRGNSFYISHCQSEVEFSRLLNDMQGLAVICGDGVRA